MASSEMARLIAELSLKDKLTPGVNKALGSVGKLETGLQRATRGAGQVASGMAKAGTRIAAGIGIGLAGAAKAAIDWEDAFTGVVKTVDASDSDLAGLSDQLRKLSTQMPTTAIDLAAIAEAAGAMGVGFDAATGKTNTDTIAAFTKQIAILGATTNLTTEEAATGLGQLTNVLGLQADEFDNFSAALVDLGNKGASTEAQIFEIARRAGGAAKLFGIAKEETLGWASAAANLGLNEELAGTALQNVFVKLLPKFTQGAKDLQKVTGKTAKELKRAFKEDAGGAVEDLIQQLGEMPKDKRLAAVQDLFGKGSGLTRLVLGLADSFDKNLKPALDTSADAWADATAAQIEFEKRNTTVKSALARLKNGVIDAGVTIGEGFVDDLGRASTKLAEFLGQDANRSALRAIGKDIGESIADIDWKEVVSGAKSLVGVMKVALDFAKKLYDAFNLLPTPLKGAVVGLAALDKLSGGLVGGGLGGIVGGLGSAVAKTMAASIPLFGRAFVQPVFVTNMGAGLPGGGTPVPGGKGGGLGVIGSLGIAGAILALAVPLGEAFAAALPAELKGPNGAGESESQRRIREGIAAMEEKQGTTIQKINTLGVTFGRGSANQVSTTERVKAAQQETKRETVRSVNQSKASIVAAESAGSNRIVSAIQTNRPIVNVDVDVSSTSVVKQTVKVNRYGPTGGSRTSGGKGRGGLGGTIG